ncbi:uncharacterized protein GGS22DRAFT_67535 [Annulohypoxylon maeteangense]|uniref:uncharacterized protein n=1 Tax=Annulohypoxylon maeteangense TaxID=1927788 RepID=UPI0020075010|nr:uncharacterized protein GGS22DRAFT_67535 [Annulohypoxylon maeteangense]KAI0889116.1 hypothetical protein GGS22DRAFT_67535 [Annulohypoxylon maeteangense]
MAVAHHLKRKLQGQFQQWFATVAANLQKNNLWRRIIKNTICTTINLIIGLIPAVIAIYGKSTYLGAMASVFGHPGQRFGQMTESLMLITLGSFFGIAWAILGLYLSSLVHQSNIQAALAIKAIFFTLALLFHGITRSSAPRLFLFVFFFLLINITILTGTTVSVSSTIVTNIAYPILTAVGVIIFVNITVFPEFSSGFLGKSTIETLCATVNCFQESGDWFMSDSKQPDGEDAEKEKAASIILRTKLIALTEKKAKLRAQLGSCKKAQAESNFELVFAVLPPRSLKPISMTLMSRLVQITICLINACESKYALAGHKYGEDELEEPEQPDEKTTNDSDSESESDSDSDSSSESGSDAGKSKKTKKSRRKSKYAQNIELIKPVREIESGDIELLEHILCQIRGPAKVLQEQIQAATYVISSALAYCYDVPRLPSGAPTPKGIPLEEIDLRVNMFAEALLQFDQDSAMALEHAACIEYGRESHGDIMPRMETHLISSFLISVRQAASQTMDMLKHSRALVERRQSRNNHRRLYFPRIGWKKWLASGGEHDVNALPETARKEARTGHGLKEDLNINEKGADGSEEQLLRHAEDEETGHVISKQPTFPEKGRIPMRKGPQKSEASNALWLRGLAADIVEFFAESDDLAYALKMCIAAFIITWPAFVPATNAWYNSIRGSWASLQLVLVFEVSVGTSFQGFFLRVFGVIFGCVVGFLAYEIGQGNRIVAVVVLVFGIIPSSYIHLGTPFVKTGIISLVSMSVVGLATILQPSGDQTWEIFVKRMVCFLVGGTIALLVEMFLFPVRARDRLVESLASTIQQISQMESSVAVGIDSPQNVDIKSHALSDNFKDAMEKAEEALTAARTFLPFCLTEPRMKGSFKGQALIYGEMIYVLFQIIDRMDNMLHLRKAYGSSVIEELNADVLPYRRNVAASMMLTLFAVSEALTTRLPLPQFLPSSRVAQLRYISRVRELLLGGIVKSAYNSGTHSPATTTGGSIPLQPHVLKSMTRQSFLSWNASSAGMMEIIEYLEELVDLAKLLVGVNAFRSGMLERPKFHEYARKIKERESDRNAAAAAAAQAEAEQQNVQMTKSKSGSSFIRRRRGFTLGKMPSHGTVTGAASSLGVDANMLRRTSTALWGHDGAADDHEEAVDDLPMSLQRVMTKRMEGRQRERREARARRDTNDPKGKRPLVRPSATWAL